MGLARDFQLNEERNTHQIKEPTSSTSTEDSAYQNLPHASDDGSLASPQYFALVSRATHDAVRDWDVKAGRLAWPQGLENLLGYAPGPASSIIAFWRQNLHAEDRARIAASIQTALEGEAEHWSGEYRLLRADGSYVLVLERALILRDGAGAASRFIGSIMDITARKQLQDQLIRSQKMEAFGRLAGGVAHDFNNSLTTVLGYTDLMLHDLAPTSKLAGHIREIRGAAERASALTTQLLAFSRRQPLEPRVVEVNALITNVERSLLRLLGENISVICHLHNDPRGAHIKVDPGQLTQILLNLAVNAREAMGDGGQLEIQTSAVRLPQPPENAGVENFQPGAYVLIRVSDNGCGMSDEAKAHLFEPFFSTKSDGSGLGLATSYGIVCQSGGLITVESELERGTTINIYLPKVDAVSPPARKQSQMPRGHERVLVLEDDVSVRHLSVRVLRSLGYDVIEAASANDAKHWMGQRRRRKLHLLLTDMVMPDMSGRRFADWLREASPETRVLFVSGYLHESLQPGERPAKDTFFLPKPFDPEQLARKVREALEA